MKILFQLFSHEPQTRLAVAFSTAKAAVEKGHTVSFFLAGDGVYLAEPSKYVRSSKALGGLADPLETLNWLRTHGVQFIVERESAAFAGTVLSENVVAGTFEQLAVTAYIDAMVALSPAMAGSLDRETTCAGVRQAGASGSAGDVACQAAIDGWRQGLTAMPNATIPAACE